MSMRGDTQFTLRKVFKLVLRLTKVFYINLILTRFFIFKEFLNKLIQNIQVMKNKRVFLKGICILILASLSWFEVWFFNSKFLNFIAIIFGANEIQNSFITKPYTFKDYGKYYWKLILGVIIGTILSVLLIEFLKYYEITF